MARGRNRDSRGLFFPLVAAVGAGSTGSFVDVFSFLSMKTPGPSSAEKKAIHRDYSSTRQETALADFHKLYCVETKYIRG